MDLGRDQQATRAALRAFLRAKLNDPGVEVGEISAPSGAGFVNETLFFDATSTHAGRLPLVLRIQPSAYSVAFEGAEFFASQCELMRILASQTEVAVPAVRWYESDAALLGAPFVLTDRAAGAGQPDFPPYNTGGWLFDASPKDQARAWWATVETIAKINMVDWQGLGLDFLLDPGRGAPGLEQRFGFFDAAYVWASGSKPNPTIEAARQWLHDHRPVDEPVVLSWGDARIGNLIFDDFEVTGVVDWEFASLGPPLQDLGWWWFVDRAMFGDLHAAGADDPSGLPGFASRAQTLDRWSRLTGFETGNIDYYEAFAGYRLAMNSHRMGMLFIEMGVLPEDSRWPVYNSITQALAGLIGIEHPEPEQLPQLIGG
jgi:aminoglycoside phosphotransferase (APT) family kinase protein